jgi:hypothetical protein
MREIKCIAVHSISASDREKFHVESPDGVPEFGFATRFVQNGTLAGIASYLMGFHKRSFAHDFRNDANSREFPFKNPLS